MAERAEADIFAFNPSVDPPVCGKRKKKSKKEKKSRKIFETLAGLTQGGTDEGKKKKKSKGVKKKKKGESADFREESDSESFLQQQEPVSVTSDTLKAPKKKKEKTLRKKKVAFDVFPRYRPAKQPRVKVECSTSAANDRETSPLGRHPAAVLCRDDTDGGPEDDSQGTGANSEDLFITQKTFLASPTETPSSCDFNISDSTSVPERMKKQRKHKPQQQPTTTGKPHPPLWGSSTTSEAATQTDDVINPPAVEELSVATSLRFHQMCRAAEQQLRQCSEEQPVDLSLPDRTRAEPGPLQSPPSPGSQVKDEEVTPPNGPPPPPTPRSSTTDTTSSEDGEARGRSMADRAQQVNAVQMRLNECFFFKVKGDELSPRPESPLMKFNQSSGKTKTKTRKKK